MKTENLPLFPLNTVLFPGAPLTLHIFEERYRQMIAYCLEKSSSFGVVFNLGVSEIEHTVFSALIGTVAEINASVRLDDGRYLIATVGQQRFRVHHIVQQTPYIIAAVEMLSDESNIRDMGVTSELQATYKHYWQAVAAATGSQNQIEQLPDDTVAMTYHLAHQMQVTNERKQRWLESDVVSRAKDIVSMLHAEMALLPGSADNDVPGETNWPWSWN